MRAVIFCMRRRIASKITRPEPIITNMTIKLSGVSRTNSKKSRISGMAKAAAIIPMIAMRRPARSLLRGLEIQ